MTLSVLIVDDERPALDELEFLLRRDARVGRIRRAATAGEAAAALRAAPVDAAFLDIHMPGASGLELARALRQAGRSPALVFVTADEDRAIDAFELAATDYLLKPVREARLRTTIDRILAVAGSEPAEDEVVAVLASGAVRRVRRRDIRFVQAQGDYARLHTADGSHLLRATIGELAERWEAAGFVRIHRGFLVARSAVAELRLGRQPAVLVDGLELPVSRRLLPAVRERLGEGR
ncbi:LytR/AlgR family response regulator transcription factor [Homoserinibacter sp. YIM 151385]|uniref:LytR/AlgR family response regulator transcription factor n=1 Tax=Homoserinibacter sp. YIM 151385 TaxID=2985506 RepID=UPI0022EFEA9A|nr:LytTR family DNA-binding domain-containing protein [Homoserinibacter sp. YIM 151385]WBU38508.1 LytTR family DNA-binding domain-containing protein [Homoserinibacter sp. YIM 151385]